MSFLFPLGEWITAMRQDKQDRSTDMQSYTAHITAQLQQLEQRLMQTHNQRALEIAHAIRESNFQEVSHCKQYVYLIHQYFLLGLSI